MVNIISILQIQIHEQACHSSYHLGQSLMTQNTTTIGDSNIRQSVAV